MQNSNSLNSNNILVKNYLFFNLMVILGQNKCIIYAIQANYHSLGTIQTGSCSFHSSNILHVLDITQDRINEFDFRV